AKQAGAALIGIFHDRDARESVANRQLDMTPVDRTAKELLQC
ncbi:ABC transporter, partial [Pseudomonas syringae pv. actinidiae str. M302091]